MRLRTLPILAAILLVGVTARAEDAVEEQQDERRRFYVSAGLSVGYDTGDFGEDDTTDTYSSSLYAKLEYEPITVKVSIPYVVIDGPALPNEGAAGGVDDDGPRNGVGELVTKATYTYFPEKKYVPIVDVSGKLKIPVVDEEDSLGTGKTDVTAGLELTEVLGPVSVFGGGAYSFKGGNRFRNIWLASAGANVRLAKVVSVGLAYDFRQGSLDEKPRGSHELVPSASFRLGDHWRLGPYAIVGLSQNSPDWGVGATLSLKR